MADELVLTIDIAASPETVFRFLSDAALFKQWMGAGALLSAAEVTVRYPNGNAVRGTLRESVPNRRIVFGWGYEDGKHGLLPDATTVTIELEKTASGTRVTLRHAGLDAAQQSEHRQGWTYYLAQLASGATNLAFNELLPQAVNNYLAAWNETDAGKREALLAACWDDAGIFRDSMGTADGRAALNRYIGGAQQFAPGIRLELDNDDAAAPPEQCHGYYRFSWAIRLADGKIMGRGTNFGQLTAAGRFASAVGFWNRR